MAVVGLDSVNALPFDTQFYRQVVLFCTAIKDVLYIKGIILIF